MAHEQSILMLAQPGAGKSEAIVQIAAEAGLPCRSLLGTQIAPEDVSGIPRIVGERTVFCPPRILLPEDAKPFCLFLDELPACSPDIQKAFYSLLLERRLGEHFLPKGTWVVAAGNRAEDRSLVRSLSAALVNRVIVLNIRVDVKEWQHWAAQNNVRQDIRAFIAFMPEALMRSIPQTPAPFSTPRAWTSLSRALDRAEAAGILDGDVFKALAFGCVSPEDAAVLGAFTDLRLDELKPIEYYIQNPENMPAEKAMRWFLLKSIKKRVGDGSLRLDGPASVPAEADMWSIFFASLANEEKASLLIGMVETWGRLGIDGQILQTLTDITGIME